MKRDLSVVAAVGTTAFAAAAFGICMPLVSLTLDDWGLSEAEIGVFTLAASLSTLATTLLVPMLLARVSVRAALSLACVGMAGSYLAMHAFRGLEAWFALRLALGAALTVMFVASEAWILERKPEKGGGLVLGVYASTLAGAIALGGFVVGMLGHRGEAVIFAAVAIAMAGLFPLLLPGPGLTQPEGASARPSALFSRIRAAPIIMMAPFAMGAIETAAYTLLPVYARRVGFDDQIAAYTIAACGLGNLALQPFVGWVGDRLGATRTLLLCALAGTILPFGIWLTSGAAFEMLGLIFVYCGLVTGLYTIGLLALSARFAGAELAAANAAYALAYGGGAVLGPAIAGTAFSFGGPGGFIAGLAAMAGAYFLAVAVAQKRRTAH